MINKKGTEDLNIAGSCRCPNCGHVEPKQLTVPCYHRKCPKCGALMTE
jgi:hypothetical protein